MVKFEEMDAHVGIRDQLISNTDGSVVLINVFRVDLDEVDAMMIAWKEDADYFRSQPGLMSTQLHRGIAGSCTFLNYAVWENLAAFRAAFGNPAFQAKLAKYPASSTASPHLFKKIAVEGICVA